MKGFKKIKMSKIFLLALIASLLYFLGKSLFKPITRPAQVPRYKKKETPPETEMVQDPVCGVFVDPDKALKLVSQGVNYYFCSDACERKFKKGLETKENQ